MQTKPLLYGLIGFFLGGLLVAIAATTFNKPNQESTAITNSLMSVMSMNDMTADLKNKTGDEFDKAFISSMIAHHEGAVEMAKLSAKHAKHEEIKSLSSDIIAAGKRNYENEAMASGLGLFIYDDGPQLYGSLVDNL